LYLCRYANFEAATYQRLIPASFFIFFVHKICFLIFFIFY